MSRARRAAPVTAVAVALIAALGLGAGGCKKHDAKPATRPEPISAAERKRGDDACNAYLARLCACAATRPEMASRCELKQAKKEAIEMLLRIYDDPTATASDVFIAQDQLRMVISKCVEENNALDAEGCP